MILKKLLLTALATAMGLVSYAQIATAERVEVPVPEVSVDSLMKHIMELSSETYEGRMAGSAGYDRAVEYVRRTMQRYGVDFAQADMSHQFETEYNQVENCKFNTYLPGSLDKQVYTLGNEFCCVGITGRGYVNAQMVFVGYGIDEKAYNDYRGVDVQGKIVVVLTGLPTNTVLPTKTLQRYAALRDKARTAQQKGAIGMLAINISSTCRPYEPQARNYCGGLPHLPTFPMLQLTRDCGNALLSDEATTLDSALATMERTRSPHSFALTKKAEIDVNATYNQRALTSNIVGVLEGCDRKLKKEYVVVGASLDGSGMQGETCLFPGADINASGVATLIEMARVLSDMRYRPRRSIVFAFLGASEQQHLGSQIMVSNFAPLRRIEAYVDVQNVGSGDSLVVLGDKHYPTLWQVASNYDTSYTHAMHHMEEPTAVRGNAVAFDAIGIPSLSLGTTNGMVHNHVSSDIWENIDRHILVLAAQLATGTVANLGEGLYQGRSPQSRAVRF